MLRVTESLQIPDDELVERFVRASGPGGQNVNKVSTAVELRFDAVHSPSLSEPVRDRLLRLAGNRINREGVLVIRAENYRTQERNRVEARERLKRLLLRASVRPKKRIPTRPSRASIERRLKSKARRAHTKRQRGRAGLQD